jgi:hypothetical protein
MKNIEHNNGIHPDLIIAQEYAYKPNSFISSAIRKEDESKEYSACEFELNNKRIKFRTAKITPTKVGQFVTFWKRIGNGPIMPFDMADPIDLFVVSVRSGERLGQFIFPKEVLLAQGFISKDGKGGKRAMRVYPPWDVADSPQATKTQAWQRLYFIDIAPNSDHDKIKKLFI